MTPEYGFEKIDFDKINRDPTEDQENTRNTRDENSALDTQIDDTPQGFVSCFNGYTEFDGKKYKVSVDTAFSKILRLEEIDEFTLSVFWYSPQRGNPFGIAGWDLIEDKQRADSVLANLRLIDAKYATFGQTNVYDTRMITDRATLITPSLETKWIGADGAK